LLRRTSTSIPPQSFCTSHAATSDQYSSAGKEDKVLSGYRPIERIRVHTKHLTDISEQEKMDDDNRISITVCGDGGCGKSIDDHLQSFQEELLISLPQTGKSSITLRLVRSQWTSE